jgi:hypothetical protein
MVMFKWYDGRWFLTGGVSVARKNDFRKPTNVILIYRGDNKFKMWLDTKFRSNEGSTATPIANRYIFIYH